MRTYYIYWMKEAVTRLLTQDINDTKQKESMEHVLCGELYKNPFFAEKSYTKCIPTRTLRNFFKHMMHSNAYYLYHEENSTIYLDETTKACMKFDKQKMILHAVGNREVELIWFEQLRQFAPTFFVYEVGGNLCGWLSPKTQIKIYG